MRQIGNLVDFLTTVVLNKKSINYEISLKNSSSDTDLLYGQLTELINCGRINEAENLLFEKTDKNNRRFLELAVDFYAKLNRLDDITLGNNDFTRQEIEEGLKDVANIFGVSTI